MVFAIYYGNCLCQTNDENVEIQSLESNSLEDQNGLGITVEMEAKVCHLFYYSELQICTDTIVYSFLMPDFFLFLSLNLQCSVG